MTITWPYPQLCTDQAGTVPAGCSPVQEPAFVPSAAQHIEMWGVFADGRKQRLVANVGSKDPSEFTGFTVVPALDPNDRCLVRALDRDDEDCSGNSPTLDIGICGASLFSKKAHTGPDISDNDALLRQQQLVLQGRKITSRMTQFTPVDALTTGNASTKLLALTQWNPDYLTDPRRDDSLAVGASSAAANDPRIAQRRASECKLFRDGDGATKAAHPYFFVGNPHQVTKPLAGVQFGFFGFSTGPGSTSPSVPSQNFNGMSFYLPYAVSDLMQIIITLESRPTAAVALDGNAPQLFLAQRLASTNVGRGVIRMVVLANSTPPMGPPPFPMPTFLPTSAVGTISIITDLDSGLN